MCGFHFCPTTKNYNSHALQLLMTIHADHMQMYFSLRLFLVQSPALEWHICVLTKFKINRYRISKKLQQIPPMEGYQNLAWNFYQKMKLIPFITSMLKLSVLALEEVVGTKWRTLLQCNNGHLHALAKVWVMWSFYNWYHILMY